MSVKALTVHTLISLMLWMAILSLISLMIRGQEIEDLGLITERQGVVLEHHLNPKYFLRFEIEMDVPRGTNSVTLIRTNDFLTLDDFGTMPEGLVIGTVKTVRSDGKKSPLALFRVEISRSELPKPTMRVIGIGGLRGQARSLTTALQEITARRISAAAPGPIPSAGGPPAREMGTSGPVVTPMRGGTNKTYSEHMAEMKAFFDRKTKK